MSLKSGHLTSEDYLWIEQRTKENLLTFYREELLEAHRTQSKPDIDPSVYRKLKQFGFILLDRWPRNQCKYSLSPEALKTLEEE